MDTDTTARPWRGFGRLAAMAALAALLVMSVAAPAHAGRTDDVNSEGGDHCVAHVVGQAPDGELVVSPPDCYGTFSQAMFAASGGSWRLPNDAPVTVLESSTAGANFPRGGPTTLGSSVLATHYDYHNGGGSSITIYGSGCWGYWNTWTSWDNRISSTYNGCYKTQHYDWPNLLGNSATFYGHYRWNIYGFMDNRTESIRYSNW